MKNRFYEPQKPSFENNRQSLFSNNKVETTQPLPFKPDIRQPEDNRNSLRMNSNHGIIQNNSMVHPEQRIVHHGNIADQSLNFRNIPMQNLKPDPNPERNYCVQINEKKFYPNLITPAHC